MEKSHCCHGVFFVNDHLPNTCKGKESLRKKARTKNEYSDSSPIQDLKLEGSIK